MEDRRSLSSILDLLSSIFLFDQAPLKEKDMDTWTFGWTVALIGMGGTMLVLWFLSLLILLLKKIFPYKAEEKERQEA